MADEEKQQYCDGDDDETPEQARVAAEDAARGLAEIMGISFEEAMKRLGW